MRRFWIKLPDWTSGPFDTPEAAGEAWPRVDPGSLDLPRLWVETDAGMVEAPGRDAHRALVAMVTASRRERARAERGAGA